MYYTSAIKPPSDAKFRCFPEHDGEVLPSSFLIYPYEARETIYHSLCCGEVTLGGDESADHHENTESPRKEEIR
jgi:hypothetical protein